jgi:ribosome-associated translation inhibitor RaiA
MKMTIQHVHVRSTDTLDSLVEGRILALEERIRIEEARVRLECRFEESPGFRAAIHIVTPGPDLVVESCDHTLEAAIEKAVASLESKLRARSRNRIKRRRSQLQMPAAPRLNFRRA